MKNLKINELNSINSGWFWQEDLNDEEKKFILKKLQIEFVHRWFLPDYFISVDENYDPEYDWDYGDAKKGQEALRSYKEKISVIDKSMSPQEKCKIRKNARKFAQSCLLDW